MLGYLEGDGQGLVAAPVGGQHRAEEIGAVGAHELARVVRQDLYHVPLGHAHFGHQGGATGLLRLSQLSRTQTGGGGCEATPGGRV